MRARIGLIGALVAQVAAAAPGARTTGAPSAPAQPTPVAGEGTPVPAGNPASSAVPADQQTSATSPPPIATPGAEAPSAQSSPPVTPPPEQLPLPTSGTGRVVSLAQAEASALARQPQIMQARAQTRQAYAQIDEQFAPMLPQVTATATYGRATANFVPQPGALPSSVSARTSKVSFDTTDSYNFGVTASQLVYDFGQASGSYHVAQANAEAQVQSEETTRFSVLFGVRSAYALAWANRSFVAVAMESLANADRHLHQIEGFVRAGARPEIDLAQVRADRANAQLALINAEGAYATAKAQLNQAMGVEESTDYDVGGEAAGAVTGEELDERRLIAEAIEARPELKGLAKQVEANERQLSATKGAYGPTLGVSTSLTEGGSDITALAWNWRASANLNWPLFQGGVTNARVREAEANLDATRSQIALEKQQIRLDIVQARLQIRGAKASLDAAREVELNARERLRLAEARYRAGAGSIIELDDAQAAATTAAGQVVQAEYSLAVARAQLAKGLGQR